MEFYKELNSWAIYRHKNTHGNTTEVAIVNPHVDPIRIINLNKRIRRNGPFSDISFKTVSSKINLLGCSDLVIIIYCTGYKDVYVLGKDGKLKLRKELSETDSVGTVRIDDKCKGIGYWALEINGVPIYPTEMAKSQSLFGKALCD